MSRGSGRAVWCAVRCAVNIVCLSALCPFVSAHPVAAQTPPSCRTISSEVTLGPLSGRIIDSVAVISAAPDVPSQIARFVNWMHVRTRPDVIRQNLLFTRGDTVDTLRVAESLRRLRRLSYISHVDLVARDCSAATMVGTTANRGPVAITVETRDAWTTGPDLKVGGRAPRVGLTERNLLGTGRTVALDIVSNERSLGIATSVSDALGFGTGLATRAQYQRFSNGSIRLLSITDGRRSATDLWRSEADILDLRREPLTLAGDDFERTAFSGLVGRRVSSLATEHAVHVLGGIEWQHTRLDAAAHAQLLGPALVQRQFFAPDIGVAMTATRFDTLTWLLPSHGIVDVPRALEGEVVVGIGRGSGFTRDTYSGGTLPRLTDDRVAGVVTHIDAWLGREWLPTRTSRVVADVWTTGYQNSGEWHAGSVRTAMTLEHAAFMGKWEATVAAERLTDPDPDVRALSLFDRSLPFIPTRSRLSESAFAFSISRSRHLRRVSSALELDASAFGAMSRRWDPAASTPRDDNLGATIVGAGLSLTPTHQGRSTIRLDIGIPVMTTLGVSRSPRLVVTLVPWLESTRHRAGADRQ